MSAHEEAESRWLPAPGERLSLEFRLRQNAFVEGASWIADPENAELVEAVARAMYESQPFGLDFSLKWDDDAEMAEAYRYQAIAALTALRNLMEGK